MERDAKFQVQKERSDKANKRMDELKEKERKLKEIESLISGMWDDESVCAGEIREILNS